MTITDEGATDDGADREFRLIENEGGWWTVIDSERGAVADADTRDGGLAIIETLIEEIDGVSVSAPEESDASS